MYDRWSVQILPGSLILAGILIMEHILVFINLVVFRVFTERQLCIIQCGVVVTQLQVALGTSNKTSSVTLSQLQSLWKIIQ